MQLGKQIALPPLPFIWGYFSWINSTAFILQISVAIQTAKYNKNETR